MRDWVRIVRAWRLEIVAFMVGVVVLAFELTASRIVAPYMGTTIYVWTSIIGVILAALAAGYAWGGIWADKRQNINDVVFLLVAAALVIGMMAVLKDWLLAFLTSIDWPVQLQGLSASLLLFALPTVLLGAVSPYLARMNITAIGNSGKKLSRISAAGTVGSLVGTFLTGYVLFGLIGTRNLLILLAVTLVAVSFLLAPRKQRTVRIVIIVYISLLGLFSSQPHIIGFYKSIDTDYSRVIIRDVNYLGRPVRALQTDSDGLQSGVYLDGSSGLALDYIRSFAYVSQLKPDAKRYLIIGGGAFTFPEYLAKAHPDATVDTVEIDSKLVGISKQYFHFQQPANLHIYNSDGRQYLNENHKPYDMIFLDAFSSKIPPFQLTTKEAIGRMHASLKQNGMVVANVISMGSEARSPLIRAYIDTYKTGFSDVTGYRVTPQLPPQVEQNLILIAANKPLDQALFATVRNNNPEFNAIANAQIRLDNKSGLILSDDFAPVEQLAYQ